MEFNARFALTGTFTLAVIVAIFGFVYWVDNAGGFGARNTYQVRFTIPVSGIATGGNVFFNGLKVGEITSLELNPEKPSELVAEISVERGTPVNIDTRVGIDYQGLTGAANISLTGGRPGSKKLVSENGEIPQLLADPAASRSWTQNAGRVLGRIDDIFGRNSERFDSIIAGLERMTGGGEDEILGAKHDLRLPEFKSSLARQNERPDWQLAISEPSVVLSLNTDKVQRKTEEATLASFANALWTDNLPNLVQAKILRSFEDAGFADTVLRPDNALDARYRLSADIREFHIDQSQPLAVSIDIMVKIIDSDGNVVGTRHFQSKEAVRDENEAAVIEAFNVLFSRTMEDLVRWSLSVL